MTNEESQTSDTVAQLQQQLALVMTDNETLTEQNARLHDEVTEARRQTQEVGDMNNLLVKKVERLESRVAELGQHAAQYKEGFEKMTRRHAEEREKNRRLKALEKPEPIPINGGK